MIPWKMIDAATIPGSAQRLRLFQRGDEFSIRGDNFELMNSRQHGSEDALARLACGCLSGRSNTSILIGGLGMGFTLAAALKELGADSRVAVAELVPAVIRWNRGPLAELAGNPLSDKRVTVHETDIAGILKSAAAVYDTIVFDVDNGPNGLTRQENDWLYGPDGLKTAYAALRSGGVLAVWSASPDSAFPMRLRRAGFSVEEVVTPARRSRKGGRHTIWLATRD
jgi:spermidine synthase